MVIRGEGPDYRSRLRALFVNENLGGHAALHRYLRAALAERSDVEPTIYDVPAPRLLRKLSMVPVPGLARLDADLQALRCQLALSLVARRFLSANVARHHVLHVYTQNAALLSVSLMRRLPTVVSTDTTNLVNNYQLPHRRSSLLTRASLVPGMSLERRVFDAATLVVAQSRWTAEQLGAYGVDPDRVRVIPFGVVVPPPTEPAELRGRLRVTFVGSKMQRKGGWRLVRLFEQSAVLRDRCQLTLVTRDPVPPRPGVEVLNDVRPGDERLARVLAETAVFALPTEIDKAPFALLEAMAAGVAVVSTTVGAIPEMVVEGTTGLLVSPGDDRALANALATLVQDAQMRRRMGAAGRARVLERFDARRTTASLVDVLEEARGLHVVAADRHPARADSTRNLDNRGTPRPRGSKPQRRTA